MNQLPTISVQTRKKVVVNGTVQGVGFRPYIYRLATELELSGHVRNGSDGVTIEVEGSHDSVLQFLNRLPDEAPTLSMIRSIDSNDIARRNEETFVIKTSVKPERSTTGIPPDIAVCQDCLTEMFDTSDRRYRYPFINCTNCGPRFTIVQTVPYDRHATSMASFEMCPDCKGEYGNPMDRRFHAQPVACPSCGPKVWLHNGDTAIQVEDVIEVALDAIANGQILALRGLGGFHLAVDPSNETAVHRLRKRKRRMDRPFALMVRSIEAALKYCCVSDKEQKLLTDPSAPIVLLRRRPDTELADSISVDNPYLGLMLPYTPLHHLLLDGEQDALVMTSGNISDEPIAIENEEALKRLNGLIERGNYHVGPLARFNLNFDRLPSSIQSIAKSIGLEPVCKNPFKSILIRGLEMLYAFEESIRIVEEYERPDKAYITPSLQAGVGYGCTEAPRGICWHKYEIADDGTVMAARIVPPTSQNQGTIEDDLRQFVSDNITLPEDQLTWRCEQAIRNYDPCISCSCHFLKLNFEQE